MKFSFPSEAYCSFISFAGSFGLCSIYSLWRGSTASSILPTAVHFAVISGLSTGASALISHQISLRRSSVDDNGFHPWRMFSIAWRAGLLGGVFGFGLYVSNVEETALRPFGIYLCILSFFHWSEYFTTAISCRETLTLDSFLLNHSVAYWAAAAMSWVEFGLEYYFCPCKLLLVVLDELHLVRSIGSVLLLSSAQIVLDRHLDGRRLVHCGRRLSKNGYANRWTQFHPFDPISETASPSISNARHLQPFPASVLRRLVLVEHWDSGKRLDLGFGT